MKIWIDSDANPGVIKEILQCKESWVQRKASLMKNTKSNCCVERCHD